MENSALEYITVAIAVGGFVLGLVNLWLDYVRHRPHAEVSFSETVEADGLRRHVITILNSGFIPITVVQVGLECGEQGFIPVAPPFCDNSTTPKRIESGDSAIIKLKMNAYLNRNASHPVRPFIQIAGGTRVYAKAVKTDLVAFAINHGTIDRDERLSSALLPIGSIVWYGPH